MVTDNKTPAPSTRMRVKPLEWTDRGGYGNTFDAKALGHIFCITQPTEEGPWHFWIERGVKALVQTKHDTLEGAKGAAQEQWEMLLSEVYETPSPQPREAGQ